MKTYCFWIVFVTFSLTSCEKDDNSFENLSENPLKLLEEVAYYDLNDDSVNDIKIVYDLFTWFGINSSDEWITGEGISGRLRSLNGSSVLQNRNSYTLFNKLYDTIKIEVSEPYYWDEHACLSLISIRSSNESDNLWENEWSIRSDMIFDYYYLAVKLNVNDSNLIGWLEIKFNKLTGGIQILESKFTTKAHIVIGK
ncbi:hypothetical protein [Natronoflexus pectinivorans]|uniref:Uncharacterized protein n=1 Tax=Natronoflexus pectinivorans TaxID=682526 RepID=A0A4R2GFM0_9BACT|nr:hypothetical protein [Natronoflexus pectinivorans]TCO06956.1 hypothetical protein EV194_11173 [Natronoflexus pectinivorans]